MREGRPRPPSGTYNGIIRNPRLFSKSAFMACMAAAMRAEGRPGEKDEQEAAQEAPRAPRQERGAKERTGPPPPASGAAKERVLQGSEGGPRAAPHFAPSTDHQRRARSGDGGAVDPRRDTDTLKWHPAHTTRASDTI